MKILEGKKTYIGIVVVALGYFGVSGFVSDSEVASTFDSIAQIVGMVMAIYGRYKAK